MKKLALSFLVSLGVVHNVQSADQMGTLVKKIDCLMEKLQKSEGILRELSMQTHSLSDELAKKFTREGSDFTTVCLGVEVVGAVRLTEVIFRKKHEGLLRKIEKMQNVHEAVTGCSIKRFL